MTVIVAGAAMTPFNRRKDGSGFRDWAADAFGAALADSGFGRGDVDALFVASESDFFTLQLNPASVLASDLGLVGAATMRVEGGGASGQLAIHAAVQAIWAKTARCVAVIGIEPSASQLSPNAVKSLYGYSFDAWTDGMTGASSTVLYALSALAYMQQSGATVEDFAAVAVQNRKNACLNPNAHLPLNATIADVLASPMIASPYRRLDCSPLSDGAAVVILTAEGWTPGPSSRKARITGIGAASDHARLGSRPAAGSFRAKTLAMQRACNIAAIKPSDIGLAEIYDSYSGAQLQGIEALGLSDDVLADHRSGAFLPTGRLPVNLSGGLLGQGAPVGAVGVGQIVTSALQLEGRYHAGLQTDLRSPYALADTHGGIATTAAVTILKAGGP